MNFIHVFKIHVCVDHLKLRLFKCLLERPENSLLGNFHLFNKTISYISSILRYWINLKRERRNDISHLEYLSIDSLHSNNLLENQMVILIKPVFLLILCINNPLRGYSSNQGHFLGLSIGICYVVIQTKISVDMPKHSRDCH